MNGTEMVLAAVDISKRGAGLGLVGGIVVTAVAVAAFFLLRNMNQRIKRLPATFDEPTGAGDGAADAAAPTDASDSTPSQ